MHRNWWPKEKSLGVASDKLTFHLDDALHPCFSLAEGTYLREPFRYRNKLNAVQEAQRINGE
jgi:hypothetical protein